MRTLEGSFKKNICVTSVMMTLLNSEKKDPETVKEKKNRLDYIKSP